MKVGKHVVVKKGEHTDERGIIMSQVGVGHARKWVVRFENDAEIAFHARSLELEKKYMHLVKKWWKIMKKKREREKEMPMVASKTTRRTSAIGQKRMKTSVTFEFSR